MYCSKQSAAGNQAHETAGGEKCNHCCACRVHITPSAVEVRFQNLTVEAAIFIGNRSMPTVGNSFLNVLEVSSCFFWVKGVDAKASQDYGLMRCSPSSA